MSKVCEICGKAPSAGRNVSHSHRVTNRTFRPNIQKVTIKLNGKVKRANVCTKCLKAARITAILVLFSKTTHDGWSFLCKMKL